MEFKNYKNMIERPYIVYAACECSLIPTNGKYNIAKHVPNSACFFLVCSYDAGQNVMWQATGEYCVAKMVVELGSLATKCIAKMKEMEPMNLTRSELSKHYNAKHCHICSRSFDGDDDPRGFKVKDHCHLTGSYRGAAHNKCNFYFFCNRFLPVVMHNLKGYDSHLIIKDARRQKDRRNPELL